MTDCPPIVVYAKEIGPKRAPEYVAFFMRGAEILPVYFRGNSATDVSDKARAFWAKENAEFKAQEPRAELTESQIAGLAKAQATRLADKLRRKGLL